LATATALSTWTFTRCNVIIGPKGPVVDWTNAAQGDPITDVALAWALVCAGEIPDNRAEARLHR